MLFILLASAMLLLEPDFGAATVLLATTLGLMFIGGVRLRDYFLLVVVAVGAMAAIIVTSPERVRRLNAFVNPWADAHAYGDGFQLIQSLIAIGRGEWFGVGLGGSVQKLFYLPEAHTDFVFAVLAEELGLVGIVVTILLYLVLVLRGFAIGRRAAAAGLHFQAYLAQALVIWLGLQVTINIGVNMGVLPTKGLTLPLMSYGGSSLIMTLVALALLLRIHHETVIETQPKARKRS
jgi:cell division protein FtsW